MHLSGCGKRPSCEDEPLYDAIVEGDALDRTGQNLGWRDRLGWLHHRPRMNVEIHTCYRDRAFSRMPFGHRLEHVRPAAAQVLTQIQRVNVGWHARDCQFRFHCAAYTQSIN
jgi:hypothetical protein